MIVEKYKKDNISENKYPKRDIFVEIKITDSKTSLTSFNI